MISSSSHTLLLAKGPLESIFRETDKKVPNTALFAWILRPSLVQKRPHHLRTSTLNGLESADELVELLRGEALVDEAVGAARQGEGPGAVADEDVGEIHAGGRDAGELDGCRKGNAEKESAS